MIACGNWVQAIGLFVIAGLNGFRWWFLGSVLPGVGTAMLYPCLLAAVSDAAGALGAGLLAAIVGLAWTIAAIGALAFVPGVVVAALMREQPR